MNETMHHSTISRRSLLSNASAGFPFLSLTALLAQESEAASTNPLAAKWPHHEPRARSVIFLFMGGGPSQVDLFDCDLLFETPICFRFVFSLTGE